MFFLFYAYPKKMKDGNRMKKILCIGSVTADVILKPVDELPPLGTLVIAKGGVEVHTGGCATNCAISLAKLGAKPFAACKVGADAFGDMVKKELSEPGVDISGVVTGSVATTTSVVIIASSGERSFLYSPGSAADFKTSEIPAELTAKVDIVFVAGCGLNFSLDGQPCADYMKAAKAAGKFTVMDTAWDPRGYWDRLVQPTLPYLDLFMPSIDEAAMIVGEREPEKVVAALRKLGSRDIILKMGSKGAYVDFVGEKPFVMAPFLIDNPADTTGAGDAFCAGYLYGLASGWDVKKRVEFANGVGACSVTAVGATAGIKTAAETEKFIGERKRNG